MEELIGWVLLAIFVVAAGRVGYLIYQNNRHPEQAAASAATARRDPHGETGPMIYFANDAHGRADREYQFNYKWVYDGSLHAYTWRAWHPADAQPVWSPQRRPHHPPLERCGRQPLGLLGFACYQPDRNAVGVPAVGGQCAGVHCHRQAVRLKGEGTMKRCPNPDCRSEFFFGDTKTRCPFCHSVLVQDTAPAASPRVSLPLSPLVSPPQAQAEPVFMAARPGRHHLHRPRSGTGPSGCVLQPGAQAVQCAGARGTVSVRPPDAGIHRPGGAHHRRGAQRGDGLLPVRQLPGAHPDRRRSAYPGEGAGRPPGGKVHLQPYHRLRGEARLQLSATAIWLTLGLLAALLAALACTVVYLFRSGAVAAFLLALLTACMPLFIMLIGFWILFQSVFPNRRRRR